MIQCVLRACRTTIFIINVLSIVCIFAGAICRYLDATRSFCRPQGLTPIQSRQKFHQAVLKMPHVPKRPILVVKNVTVATTADETNKSDDETEQSLSEQQNNSQK